MPGIIHKLGGSRSPRNNMTTTPRPDTRPALILEYCLKLKEIQREIQHTSIIAPKER